MPRAVETPNNYVSNPFKNAASPTSQSFKWLSAMAVLTPTCDYETPLTDSAPQFATGVEVANPWG